MMETRTLTCINCPLGCAVTVQLENGEICSVTGHTCKRGARYARQEILAPARIVTTTVFAADGRPVPVKTTAPIPKAQVLDCVRMLRSILVTLPVRSGQSVASFCDVPIVTVKSME